MNGGIRARLRRPARLAALAALALYGLAIAACWLPVAGMPGRRRAVRHWSRLVLRALRVRVRGADVQAPDRGLLLPNHVSWLDVLVLNAVLPARFVAKDEVRNWPLVGWLARRAGTLFVRRGQRADAARLNPRLTGLLRAGERLVIFAEGTTTDGRTLLPFHSALLEPAVRADCRVYPVALRYHTADGQPDTTAAFVGDCSLGSSLWRVLGQPTLHVSVAVGGALSAGLYHRRTLATLAHAEVDRLLRQPAAERHPARVD